jgi:DNA-binding SARP family transcriptional activator
MVSVHGQERVPSTCATGHRVLGWLTRTGHGERRPVTPVGDERIYQNGASVRSIVHAGRSSLGAPIRLAIHCLGPLRVQLDEHDLGVLSNRRARSVFKYLLLRRGRPTPKEQLMELLWPNAEPASARNNLNVAVYCLRRFLRSDPATPHVVYRRDGYELDPEERIWLDLDEFLYRAAAARECAKLGNRANELRHLTAAERTYRGPLFEDDPYEDWTLDDRRLVLDQYVDVVARLARHHGEVGDLDNSAAACRKILDVQSTHEIAHRWLMSTYARLGQHHLAIRQFQECTDSLRTELGLAPSPETVGLYRQILAQRAAGRAMTATERRQATNR